MFQTVPNVAKFDCLFALGHTQRAQFSVYVHSGGDPWEAAELDAKSSDIATAIIDDYIPALSTAHDFLGIVARDLEVEFGLVRENMEVAAVPGTVASPTLPGNCAVRVKFRSDVGAPRTGGITFMPPAENQVTGDLLETGAQTALQAAAQSIHDAAGNGIDRTHVIVSRYQGSELVAGPGGQTLKKPKLRVTGGVPTAVYATVTTVSVDRVMDSMRSRLTPVTS